MKYIEPHAHMVSRTTDDYEKLALAGCEALCEPAFWAGFDAIVSDHRPQDQDSKRVPFAQAEPA